MAVGVTVIVVATRVAGMNGKRHFVQAVTAKLLYVIPGHLSKRKKNSPRGREERENGPALPGSTVE